MSKNEELQELLNDLRASVGVPLHIKLLAEIIIEQQEEIRRHREQIILINQRCPPPRVRSNLRED